MGSRRKRSKRRSRTRERPEPVFFADRNLDSLSFVEPLLESGFRVERFFHHFTKDDTPDQEWARLCADNGWLALTGDKDIASIPDEIDAVMRHGACLFILTFGRGTHHPLLAENLIRTASRVLRFHRHHPAPFIAKVNRPNAKDWEAGKPGSVRMYRTYESWLRTRRRRRDRR